MYVINAQARQLMIVTLPRDLVNFSGLRQHNEPSPVSISQIAVIPAGQGRYDLVATVKNSNEKWAVYSFTYHFSGSNLVTEKKKGFILPGEEKFLVDLGVESKSRPVNLNLNITGLEWRRIDAHEIANYNNFYNERLGFKIDNIKFYPAATSGLGDKLPVSAATFDVYNATAYNYWQVGFYVALYRGGSLTAINYITASQFRSGDKASLEVRWFEPISSVSQIVVEPEVNILNPAVYMEFGGGGGGLERPSLGPR